MTVLYCPKGMRNAACAALALALVVSGLSCERQGASGKAAEEDRAVPAALETRETEPEPAARLSLLLDKRDQEIEKLVKRIERLETEVRSLRSAAPREKAPFFPSSPASPGSAPAPSAATSGPPAPESSPAAAGQGVDEENAQAALDRLLIKKSSLLLPAGSQQIEPAFSYIHSSSDKIIIDGVLVEPVFVVGEIVSRNVRRDIFIPALTYRLGLMEDLQTDVYVPYRFEAVRTVTADTSEEVRRSSGIGDVEIGLSHQLTHEGGWAPVLLGHLRWKAKTGSDPLAEDTDDPPLGTGFDSVQLAFTSMTVQDPVAFFGGLSYTLNISDVKRGQRVDPGDIWGVNLGMALALNMETSLSFGWEQRFTDRTTVEDRKVAGSALRPGTFRIGVTHTLTRSIALDVLVGIGLTQDAPDVQATVALPIHLPNLFTRDGGK